MPTHSFLWVCPYQHGNWRRRDSNKSRHRHALPQPAWFLEKVKQCGLERHMAPVMLKSGHRTAARAAFMVQVEAGRQFRGVLTPWSDEERLLWQYIGMPSAKHKIKNKDFVPQTVLALRGSYLRCILDTCSPGLAIDHPRMCRYCLWYLWLPRAPAWYTIGAIFFVFCTFGTFTTCFTRNAHFRPGPSCDIANIGQVVRANHLSQIALLRLLCFDCFA